LQVWLAVFANIWLLGMVAMALWAALSWLRVRRQVRESVPEDGVYLCDRISSPFLFGLIRPKIYLPSCLEGDARSHVIAHEKAHLARRDHWWKPLGFSLLTVNWFNPVMWLAYILLCRDIELACDERVVRRLPAEEKKAYSSALLQCSLPRRAIAACPLAFGEVGVKQRVRSILNYRKPTFWVIVTAAVLIGILAVCLLTDPVAETPDPEETTHTEPHQDPEADEPNLGISLRLEQITPESATLVCTQDGTPWHEIITGAPWSLQALRDGVWVDLMPEDSFWTAEAYPIPIGESRSFQLDWSRDVGTLEPGFYRIAKTFSGYAQVTLHQSESESVTRTCYAVFEINPLGIHLDVADVTPGGATLVCTQDGTPWREITTGSEWTLEQLTDGGWVSVLPEDTTWTAISIGVNQNGTTSWNLSWEQIVGELGPGQYRVGKSFLGFGEFTVDGTCALGEGVRQTCCAEFSIAGLGIALSAEDVTRDGLTLVCTQDGTPWSQILTGSPWHLEQRTADGWVSVMPEYTAWTSVAYHVPQGQTTRWSINWSLICGSLEPGTYRISKSFSATPVQPPWGGVPGERTEETVWTEFIIE
ncbi:MAG: M56 family metallopeptidase, partial [Oscillospiraceae bacterium]|nr:M56 family metallopeptidase [Oscillospiraceae bacterium]